MASTLQSQKSHSGDYLVPLLEDQRTILDRFEALSVSNGTLANEFENLSSLISKQESDENRDRDSAAGGDLREMEEKQAEIESLKAELLQLQLDRARDKKDKEVAQRQLSDTEEHVQSLEADLERANLELATVKNDRREHEMNRKRLKEDHDRLQSDLEDVRNQLAVEAKLRENVVATSGVQASELAELRRLTASLQEMLSSQLQSIGEKLTAASVFSEERQALRGHNQALEEETSTLRAKVSSPSVSLRPTGLSTDEQLDTVDGMRQQTLLESNQRRSDVDKLQLQLDHEHSIRKQWQERCGIVERYLAQEREYRTNAEVTARTRTYVAEVQEVRHSPPSSCLSRMRLLIRFDRLGSGVYLKMSIIGDRSPWLMIGKHTVNILNRIHSRASHPPTKRIRRIWARPR